VLAGERLIVDLSETEFIDSSVLNNLLAVERLAHKRGLDIALQVTAGSGVAQILELSGLNRHFGSAHSRKEAVRLVRDLDPAR
jgi:anti-anti-sigma regulatory factor